MEQGGWKVKDEELRAHRVDEEGVLRGAEATADPQLVLAVGAIRMMASAM